MDQFSDTGIRAMLSSAMSHHEAGRVLEAERGYLQVIEHGYRTTELLPLIAGIAATDGRPLEALDRWERMLAERPHDLPSLKEKAVLLHRLGRWQEAADTLLLARSVDPGDAYVMLNLGVVLLDADRRDEALVAFRNAAARWPGQATIQHHLRRATSSVVPFWHVPMLNDQRRNRAFEQAIGAAVRAHGNDARILDIGTGSGLLSMMAARAGATNIVACETVPVLAETAQKIVTANGYGEQIKVIAKCSRSLVVGEDIEQPVDILVAELLSGDILSEDLLPTFEDAHARLVRPGATILPRAVTAVGCLAGGASLVGGTFIDDDSGYDLQAFADLSTQRLPLEPNTEFERLSDDHDLVFLDLTQPSHPGQILHFSLPVTADGVAAGILQWMRVDLGSDILFENPPRADSRSHWRPILHSFPRPIEVRAGEHVELMVGHDRKSLVVVPAA